MQIRTTLPLSKALEIAPQAGEEFSKALIELQALDYATVDVCIEYGDDPDSPLTVGLARTDGVMVGFFLPSYVGEQIALPDGEPVFDLHITLAYLGSLSDLDVNQQRTLIGVVAEVARDARTLRGTLQGLAMFPPNENVDGGSGKAALYAGVQIPGLHELRVVLLAALKDAGLPVVESYPVFVPHVTLSYVDPAEVDEAALSKVAMAPTAVSLNTLTAAIGGAHFDSTMFGGQWGDEIAFESPAPRSAYRPQFTKALAVEDEAQVTIGPFYVPDFVDGHGDWVATDDLEPAFHDWMANHAHEGIRLQHDTSIVAGQVVEGYILRAPLEVDVPVPGQPEQTVKVLYPKGTPMVGTRWHDWAWPLVKSGEIRGLSMGGRSVPVEQDLP